MERIAITIKGRGQQPVSTRAPEDAFFLDTSQKILVRRIVINDKDYQKNWLFDGTYLLFYQKGEDGAYVFQSAIYFDPDLRFLSDSELSKISRY